MPVPAKVNSAASPPIFPVALSPPLSLLLAVVTQLPV
jgi:hypothetical protein